MLSSRSTNPLLSINSWVILLLLSTTTFHTTMANPLLRATVTTGTHNLGVQPSSSSAASPFPLLLDRRLDDSSSSSFTSNDNDDDEVSLFIFIVTRFAIFLGVIFVLWLIRFAMQYEQKRVAAARSSIRRLMEDQVQREQQQQRQQRQQQQRDNDTYSIILPSPEEQLEHFEAECQTTTMRIQYTDIQVPTASGNSKKSNKNPTTSSSDVETTTPADEPLDNNNNNNTSTSDDVTTLSRTVWKSDASPVEWALQCLSAYLLIPFSRDSTSKKIQLPADKPNGNRCVSATCAVCLESFVPWDEITWSTSEQCPHVFHKRCIGEYANNMIRDERMQTPARIRDQGVPCPLCRRPFVSPMQLARRNEDGTISEPSSRNAATAETSSEAASATVENRQPPSLPEQAPQQQRAGMAIPGTRQTTGRMVPTPNHHHHHHHNHAGPSRDEGETFTNRPARTPWDMVTERWNTR